MVVTDIRMPPGHSDEGIQAARRLRETNPSLGVVVLSQYADPSYALALLDTGSAGRAYVLKERVHDLDQLVGCHPRRLGRWLADRPEGRGRAGGGAGAARRPPSAS